MKTVVVLSGGLDSTVLLHHVLKQGDEALPLSVWYGQRHQKELHHAESTCGRLGLPWRLANLNPIADFLEGSALTQGGPPVPEGHYEDASMKQTVVPNRNMLLLACAGAYAVSQKARRVVYGAHAGDHAIYPDCREDFVAAMTRAFLLCDWSPVHLEAPFLALKKSAIVRLGRDLDVDFGSTWSCYKGESRHCGKCGTCVERREAFRHAEVDDPTEYAS